MKKPLINTLVQILGKIGSVLIGLITTGILTRRLGVNYYGDFVLIGSLFVFLDSLADFGTKIIGIREVSKTKSRTILASILNLRLLLAIGAYVVGVGLVMSFDGFEQVRVEAMVAMLMIFLNSVSGYWEIIFQTRLRMELKVVMDWCFPISFLVFLMSWKGEISLLWVLTMYLISRLSSLMVGWWLVSKVDKIELKWEKFDKIKEILAMSWPMGTFLLIFAAYDRAIDSLLIRNFLGSSEVAWYGLAYKMYGVLIQPASYFINNIFPILSGNNSIKRRVFINSFAILLVVSVGMVIGTNLTSPLLVLLIAGNNFEPAIGVLRILIVASVFSYLGHLFGFTLISRGRQKQLLRIGVISLILNFSLNWLIIPKFGINGAAWVTVVTEMVNMLMMVRLLL